MNISLPKGHKYRSMTGSRPVSMKDKACLNLKCFRPHNFSCVRPDGKIVQVWRCVYRENHGCPDAEGEK